MVAQPVDMVNHPPHYQGHPSGLECIQVTRGLSFNLGNAVKYLYRADNKNGLEDLKKAAWYLRDHIDNCEPPALIPLELVELAVAERNCRKKAIYERFVTGRIGDALELLEQWLTEEPPF